MQPKDVIAVMFWQDFREGSLASSPLWLARIFHPKDPTPCTEKVLWIPFINKCLWKIVAECYCTTQYSGFVHWRKVKKIKLVNSSIPHTLVLPSFLVHSAHGLEQDNGLLGYYFLEKHMLSCHTVRCRDDPAVPRNKWPPPEVWKSLQAVIPISANRYIQGKPFSLASLLLFSVQDHFQHDLQWGLLTTTLQQDWWGGKKNTWKHLKTILELIL